MILNRIPELLTTPTPNINNTNVKEIPNQFSNINLTNTIHENDDDMIIDTLGTDDDSIGTHDISRSTSTSPSDARITTTSRYKTRNVYKNSSNIKPNT